MVGRFVELQGDFLPGGIVLRTFEDFTGDEARVWWIDGEPALVTAHPDAGPDAAAPSLPPSESGCDGPRVRRILARMAVVHDRFRDPRSTEYEFLRSILVRCPGCEKPARVIPVPGDTVRPGRMLFAPRRLVCRGCGLSRAWSRRSVTLSRGTARPATDPYFGVPLWLQIRTRHGWLWAYNLEHLDLIRHFVAASLRERASWYDTGQRMTLVARLPAWIQRARNRDEVLRAVGRIHASLTAT